MINDAWSKKIVKFMINLLKQILVILENWRENSISSVWGFVSILSHLNSIGL